MMLKIINLEFVNTLPGGISTPDDRAIVIDLGRTERHIITGQEQLATVFRGTLTAAHAFVKSKEKL